MHSIHVVPERLAARLAAGVGLLVVASTAAVVSQYAFGHDYVFGFVRLFYLDTESNVPSWYASVTLLACAAPLLLIGTLRRREGDRWWRHWRALGFIFVYLSVDEAAQIHELLIIPLRDRLHLGGFLYWAWVIPGTAFVALMTVLYLRFLVALPPATRRRFVTAAVLFVGGALGVEMLSGEWASAHGASNVVYAAFTTAEETLEMLGVLVFVHALLRYLRDEVGPLRIEFGARAARAARSPVEV